MEEIQNFFIEANTYFNENIICHPAMTSKLTKESMIDLADKLNGFHYDEAKYKLVIDTLQALSYTNLNETVNYFVKMNLAGVCMIINGHALASVCNVQDLLFIGKNEDGKYFVERNKSKKKACKSRRPRFFTLFPRVFTSNTKRLGTLSSKSSTSTTSLEEKILEWTRS